MDNTKDREDNQGVMRNASDWIQDLRSIQLESLVRKIRADGWARDADDRTVLEDAMHAVQAAFPDLSPTEAAAAVQRLRQC